MHAERRTFTRNGMEVLEGVDTEQGDVVELWWVRKPVNKLMIDDKPNPYFRAEVTAGEEAARELVMAAFDKHWS